MNELSREEWPVALPNRTIHAVRLANSIVINSCDYMRIFWDAIKHYISLCVVPNRISKVSDIAHAYDFVICCAGSSICSLWDAPLPSLRFIKGQNIIYNFGSKISFSSDEICDALICGKYSIIDRAAKCLIFGATFEDMDSLPTITDQRMSCQLP